MANVRKRGATGASSLYCTRNQALARLQLRLPDFRRLCILKGVHPREPRRKTAGQNKTYYHVKDIAFLAHEPLLAAFRAARAHHRKVRRALAKGHATGAARLVAAAPRYSLDHLVRERYPTFADALRDADDPLTMVHLFASLPAERAHGIPAERVQTARRRVQRRALLVFGASATQVLPRLTRCACRRLARPGSAWSFRRTSRSLAGCAKRSSLSKASTSRYNLRSGAALLALCFSPAHWMLKTAIAQAHVCGEAITWLVPHALSQVLPADVDYRVMLTFLEFYEARSVRPSHSSAPLTNIFVLNLGAARLCELQAVPCA